MATSSALGTIPIPVANGGTGAATLTDNGVLFGNATAAIGATAELSNGQILVGSTGAAPVPYTVTSGNGSVTLTTGAGSLAFSTTFATDAEARTGTSTTRSMQPANVQALKAYTDLTFNASPVLQSNASTGAAPSGATGAVNLMMMQEGEIWEQFILGAGQTIIAPRLVAAGLLSSLDLTATEGAEYCAGILATNKHAYTIGTSAAFFIELQLSAADIGGLDPLLIGFRKQQAYDATLANYTDFAGIGARATTAADVAVIQSQLNTGGVVVTNTTDAWTDGQTRTFRVNVSAAGVVTYTIDGLAPTVTAAFTFDTGDVVTPFILHLFGATNPGAINLKRLRVGLQ